MLVAVAMVQAPMVGVATEGVTVAVATATAAVLAVAMAPATATWAAHPVIAPVVQVAARV